MLPHLTLVGAVVPALHVVYLQVPVVRSLCVMHLEPLVIGVGHGARAEDVPVSAANPRHLAKLTILVIPGTVM